METATLEKVPETPIYGVFIGYEDADKELRPMARNIKKTTIHNEDIEPRRIKFLYSDKPKKEGGRYVIFNLIKRSDMEKVIDDQYDFILTVYYDVWKDLDESQKTIQLDRALCGIDMGTIEKPVIKTKQPNSREFTSNMRQYGANEVMETSEIVHLACQRIAEEKKEEKKNAAKK